MTDRNDITSKRQEIVAKLTQARLEKGLSQAQLADLLGVTRQAISKWESDLTSPDTLRLIKLADVLDTEVEYLATGNKTVYQSPPVVVNVVEKVDRVVEKVIEKPRIHRVVRIKYRQNPFTLLLISLAAFAIGVLIGLIL